MQLALILLAWIGYFAIHSLLAASSFKRWIGRRWPRFMPAYRLAFNVFATLSLLPVLWLVYDAGGAWLWRWSGVGAWLANGAALAAVFGFLVSTRAYDMDEFLGLRQLGAANRELPPTFTISPLHRFVRHPWYGLGLILIWSRDMNAPLLVSALITTAYIVVGSWLEERKLVAELGDTYRRYMDRVPGLIPLPWKFLSADEAAALAKGRG